MIEYKVRALETGGTGALEKVRNDAAQHGWRLVSTAATSDGISNARVHVLRTRGR